MRLRFVEETKWISRFIALRESVAMPFTPSHVEAVSEDGKSYIGAHFIDGIKARPVGYDQATVSHELVLDLTPFAKSQWDRQFHDYVISKIGEPYDWKSILDFVLPTDAHQFDHAICSAFMVLALRKCGWFAWPVAKPGHMISPADLLLLVSARIAVPGI
jgi:hypothetical protein